MGITESVKASILDHLHTCLDLLGIESMTLSEDMLILTSAVDKHRFSIQEEPFVTILTGQWPGSGLEAKRYVGALHGLAIAFDNRIHTVEVRILCTPQCRILHSTLLTDNPRLTTL